MPSLVSNWDLDGFVDEQRYYCSEVPFTTDTKPVAKAILAGDLRTYVDTDIEVNKTYYTAVGSVRNGVEKVSDVAKVTTAQYNPVLDIKVVGGAVVDAKGTVTISGSATVTGDYFTGTLQSAMHTAWGWYRKVGTLQFLVKGTGNIASEWSNNLRYNLYISGGYCYLNFYTSTPYVTNNQIYFEVGSMDTFKKITINRLSTGSFKAFVDDVQVTPIWNNTNFNFSGWDSAGPSNIGDNALSMKYLRWYANEDVVP